ncbi:MAG: tRNA (adenosine(37)-N6)-threonylcarbamoyltransferase complex dimerization subunit type 1 TsaB [Candidatus Handelsmanbacteria bacterium RIFCSPLOWO2_12_FULL_64_10]|uniref:tRNA (Adenosine(37)-N6)-threonylcarbamoyltransferase complex dimerization subunit type 1 TsaB n=1 Tax=Handelsmanbacteria sp. (strain RIFCSPLOWO2_12_FULL_64_10) TaxID=1817868 RepID=A0A1F6D1E3_HANXR|nr:MAG: tRNA (adenosine(37)-N6)-threonylcarbamoyltransferase complex dimerization subunit type 1 TsaB [Candidatus Handelsmanbacteria bacterium RIFCSPLOWO2_12_FULL_64_10]
MTAFWTLGIETATAVGGVALLRDAATAAERTFERGMIHGRALAPAIEAVLRECGLSPRDIGLVAVDVGPGSHTGVRVGVAAAQGLAMGAGCALVGVGSLDAVAADGAFPAIDAGRRRVFVRLPEGDASVAVESLASLPAFGTPRAATVARLGLEKFRARGADDPAAVRPVYLTVAP